MLSVQSEKYKQASSIRIRSAEANSQQMYRIKRLGSGASGEVFRLQGARGDLNYVIKIMPPNALMESLYDENKTAGDFYQHEYMCMYQLQQSFPAPSNYVTMYRLGDPQDPVHIDILDDTGNVIGSERAILMDLAPGVSLDNWNERNPSLLFDFIVRLGNQIDRQHDEAGIANPDFTPDNVHVFPDPQLEYTDPVSGQRLIFENGNWQFMMFDFGLSRRIDPGTGEVIHPPFKGEVVGKFTTMSPEMMRSANAKADFEFYKRAENYAFVAMTWQKLCGFFHLPVLPEGMPTDIMSVMRKRGDLLPRDLTFHDLSKGYPTQEMLMAMRFMIVSSQDFAIMSDETFVNAVSHTDSPLKEFDERKLYAIHYVFAKWMGIFSNQTPEPNARCNDFIRELHEAMWASHTQSDYIHIDQDGETYTPESATQTLEEIADYDLTRPFDQRSEEEARIWLAANFDQLISVTGRINNLRDEFSLVCELIKLRFQDPVDIESYRSLIYDYHNILQQIQIFFYGNIPFEKYGLEIPRFILAGVLWDLQEEIIFAYTGPSSGDNLGIDDLVARLRSEDPRFSFAVNPKTGKNLKNMNNLFKKLDSLNEKIPEGMPRYEIKRPDGSIVPDEDVLLVREAAGQLMRLGDLGKDLKNDLKSINQQFGYYKNNQELDSLLRRIHHNLLELFKLTDGNIFGANINFDRELFVKGIRRFIQLEGAYLSSNPELLNTDLGKNRATVLQFLERMLHSQVASQSEAYQ